MLLGSVRWPNIDAKAFFTHFWRDLGLQQRQQKLAGIKDAPLLMPQLLPLIERDHDGVAEDELGRRTAPNLIDRDEARRTPSPPRSPLVVR